MIVSWNWLTDYVRLDMPVETLTERLALTGLNHESTEEVGGDLAIDLEVTSNRPDCLSHLGVAREITAAFAKPSPSEPNPRPREKGRAVDRAATVRVDEPDLCPRFTARVIDGVVVRESPWRLKKRLETLGVRPINNVVDITNYVLFECGQPLHAYDLDRLAGRGLIVRKAAPGESLRAINAKTYSLRSDMLVIADAERPVGLAGVMGGLETEIRPETQSVLIESARFDPMSIRSTSRALGLFSPSGYRFERGLDPERTEWASRRCAQLILELAGGVLREGLIDVAAPVVPPSVVALRWARIPKILGNDVPRDQALRALESLGMRIVESNDDRVVVRPPSWRGDLEREIDLIEEIARIHGYEHIPENRLVPLAGSTKGRRERIEGATRDVFTGLGFDEAATFSLTAEEHVEPLRPEPTPRPIQVEHSSRKREVALRQSVVPGLLLSRAYNEARGNADVRLFEIAHVYLPREGSAMPDEPARLGIVSGGDFFALKGAVEAWLDRFHLVDGLEARASRLPFFEAGRQAELVLNGERLGFLGEVSAEKREFYELREGCSAAELEFGVVVDRADLSPRYRRLPQYPGAARDLSMVVPVSLAWAELAREVQTVGGTLLESLDFLDTFQGGNIPRGFQSVHFGLRFRHPERTLSGEEVDRAVAAIAAAAEAKFGATLRA